MIVRTSVTHPTALRGNKPVVVEKKKEEVAPKIEKVEIPATLPVEENVEVIETPKRPRKERVKKVVEDNINEDNFVQE